MRKFNFVGKSAISLAFAFFLIIASLVSVRAAGEVDVSFKASAYGSDGSVLTVKLQPDGKLLVGGIFSAVSGFSRSSVARLNTDGTIDTTFNPPDLYDLNDSLSPGSVYKIAVQSTGKIIVGGSFGVIGSTTRGLIRLNTDGSLDSSFNNLGAQFETSEVIYDINIRPDDAIYISGYVEFTGGSGFLSSGLVRLDGNGVPDSTFQFARVQSGLNTIRTFALTTDNLLYAPVGSLGNPIMLGRYNLNGSRDASFAQVNLNAAVLKILVQPDGKVLLGGGFSTINNFAQRGISRISSDGIIDTNFNSGTGFSGINSFSLVYDINLTTDGKIVLVGSFSAYQNVQQVAVVRINLDGSRDTTFNSPFTMMRTATAAAVQADGKIILFSGNAYEIPGLQRLNTNGQIDDSYLKGIVGTAGTVNDVIQQTDGKILAGGNFTFAGNRLIPGLARFNADGTVDTNFNQTLLTRAAVVYRIAFQSSGKILIAGRLENTISSSVGIFRLNADGSRDDSFARYGSLVKDITVLANDRILVDGVIRLTADGAIDNTFSAPNLAGAEVLTTKLQADGKILIGGTFTQVNAARRGYIARLNFDGTLDTTFAPAVGANYHVTGIDVQSDGKIVLVGSFTTFNDITRFHVARVNSDGSLDSSFSTLLLGFPRTVKVQPNGRILVGGTFDSVNNNTAFRNLVRLNADGSLDFSFVNSGANGPVNRINLQADGKILLGGSFSKVNNVSAVGIARLLNAVSSERTPFDYDGDGRADVSVFRPSDGAWYLQQSTGGFTGVNFGIASDQIVPADYDGDGKTDLAVFRSGVWYLNRSSQGFTGVNFGTSTDIPVPADYDGDGKDDLAVFRPSNGTWYIQQSAGGLIGVSFGQTGDKPVAADYDGDGKANLAVFRPAAGTWYIARPTGTPAQNFDAVAFGTTGDLATPADYDGDGKTDVAVFRPSNGTWYLNRSTAGFAGIQFGQNGDRPTAGDYDGDGRADVAVYRGGAWYLNRSSAGFTGVNFGLSEDLPTPNSFVR